MHQSASEVSDDRLRIFCSRDTWFAGIQTVAVHGGECFVLAPATPLKLGNQQHVNFLTLNSF